jgi:hypothetical protein
MMRTLRDVLVLLLVVAGGAIPAQATVESEPSPAALARVGPAVALQITRAGSTTIDLRTLATDARKAPMEPAAPAGGAPQGAALAPGSSAAAPAALSSFAGLDFANWGSRRPPDTVGDVGPDYYIQAVNSAVGIYRKSDGGRVAAFTLNAFMSQGSFGNLCDTDNMGHPVVLYDSFEDRWVISDFAFQFDAAFNVVNPPGAFQCFAVSRTGDPVAGGWNFYSVPVPDALPDQAKLGIWPDGIYMAANMYGFSGLAFEGPRVWAINKAQMYAGAPSVKVVSFNAPVGEFSLLPANARLETGTPPPGTPNYFSVIWQYTVAVSIYSFHVDWERPLLSTFTGPSRTRAPSAWIDPPLTVPSRDGNNNSTIVARLMPQSQYTNIGGVESLWNVHTVGHPTASGVSVVRYYQAPVTGGSVGTTTAQAATYAPDTTSRYVPSLAVDRAGNLALGYTASSATLFPAIRYVGRLSTDPPDTLPQTETSLVEGTGSQNVGTNWGAASAMTLDPDGCTFWYTNEYYAATGGDWQTRIASFAYPSCVPASSGSLQGTVTGTGGVPIAGATVVLGSRTAVTNGAGVYQFADLPSGVYPGVVASAPGYGSAAVANVAVADGGTTTDDFSLVAAPASGCLRDTTLADFLTGVPRVDLLTSNGNAILLKPSRVDQVNTTVSSGAIGITTTRWGGQTFTAGLTGRLTRADLNLFCVYNCSGSFPSLTLSLRATSGGLPVGPDIASATIPGFNSAGGRLFAATFSSPPMVTAGTVYALIIRPVTDPSISLYAMTRSATNVYGGGQAVWSGDAGGTWTAPATGGQTTDAGFKTYVQTGYAAAGDFVSAVKDANPGPSSTAIWSTLSWTGSVPAPTGLQFQVAASNSAAGATQFVGPDGTAATFFTASGAPLSQFNGNRYLAYKAYLSTTDAAATPVLSDVTVCYASTPALTLTKP